MRVAGSWVDRGAVFGLKGLCKRGLQAQQKRWGLSNLI